MYGNVVASNRGSEAYLHPKSPLILLEDLYTRMTLSRPLSRVFMHGSKTWRYLAVLRCNLLEAPATKLFISPSGSEADSTTAWRVKKTQIASHNRWSSLLDTKGRPV
jgi:hypothetical protein